MTSWIGNELKFGPDASMDLDMDIENPKLTRPDTCPTGDYYFFFIVLGTSLKTTSYSQICAF